MDIEYEATFTNIEKTEIREKLQKLGANLVKKEIMMKRSVFLLPNEDSSSGKWLRVRDEGNEITLSLKNIEGEGKIEDQKEICLTINNQKDAEALLETIGCTRKAYQENLRECWELEGVEICIDEWPHLEPFVEVEGKSEEDVKRISEKLGFNWQNAIFDSVDYLYNKKYGVSREDVCDRTPQITFDENPFI